MSAAGVVRGSVAAFGPRAAWLTLAASLVFGIVSGVGAQIGGAQAAGSQAAGTRSAKAQPAKVQPAKRKAKPRVNPYAGCFQHTFRAYNFGFLLPAPLDYTAGTPATSPYTPVPTCRVTTGNPGDSPPNRIDESASFGRTNARVSVYRLRPEAIDPGRDAWPMYDSLGKVTLWVQAVAQKHDRTEWRFWSKDWGGAGSATGHLLATRYMTNDTPPIRVQGRACMTSNRLSQSHYAVQFPSLRSALPEFAAGAYGRPSAWGFLAASELDFSDVDAGGLSHLARARAFDDVLVSCGRIHKLARHSRSARFSLSKSPFGIADHHYLGGSSWKRCNPDLPGGGSDSDEGQCGTYGQYWAVPGSGVKVVASSTTGVAGGGLPLALVPDHLRFRAIRYIGYCDRNVPRVETLADAMAVRGTASDGSKPAAFWNRGGHAVWVFGKWWTGGSTRYVYGWTPEPCSRLPELKSMLR